MQTTTTVFRERLARTIQGETGLLLTPASARLGTGRSGGTVAPSPGDTNLHQPAISGLAVTITRVGHTLTVVTTLVGGATAIAITEAGLFASDGAALMLAAFPPVTVQTGITYTLTWTIYPEVIS